LTPPPPPPPPPFGHGTSSELKSLEYIMLPELSIIISFEMLKNSKGFE
jgi:hypothetical protein